MLSLCCPLSLPFHFTFFQHFVTLQHQSHKNIQFTIFHVACFVQWSMSSLSASTLGSAFSHTERRKWSIFFIFFMKYSVQCTFSTFCIRNFSVLASKRFAYLGNAFAHFAHLFDESKDEEMKNLFFSQHHATKTLAYFIGFLLIDYAIIVARWNILMGIATKLKINKSYIMFKNGKINGKKEDHHIVQWLRKRISLKIWHIPW